MTHRQLPVYMIKVVPTSLGVAGWSQGGGRVKGVGSKGAGREGAGSLTVRIPALSQGSSSLKVDRPRSNTWSMT